VIENVPLPGMPERDQDILNTQFEQAMEALFAAKARIDGAIEAVLEGEYAKADSRIRLGRSQLASAGLILAKLTDGE